MNRALQLFYYLRGDPLVFLQKRPAVYDPMSDSRKRREGEFVKLFRDSLNRVSLLGDGMFVVEYVLPNGGAHPQPSASCANSLDGAPVSEANIAAFREEQPKL
jgi:hypothetical protein